jgi:PAS domain S-box-containing protein
MTTPTRTGGATRPAPAIGLSPAEVEAAMGEVYARADRLVGWFLVGHFVVGLALASYYATWSAAVLGGGSVLGLFFLSRHLFPRSRTTRFVAGIGLQSYCALAIWQMHGMAEQHFWFFTACTVMILYEDWVALWPGVLLIFAQHIWFARAIEHGHALNRYFEPSQVGVTKFLWHFGIAVVQAVICSYWAYLLRRNTLREAWHRIELSRSQGALAESARRLHAILDNIPDLAWVKDREGRYVAVNSALAGHLGRPPEAIVGETDATLFDHEEARRHADQERSAIAGSRASRIEVVSRAADGRDVALETILTPILDESGAVAGTTGVARDITERRQAEEQRRRLEAQVQHAQKLESLGVLAGGIAHDFNNLLMGILGNANLARLELPAESPVKDTVRDIEAAALRAADLTKQMLAYSGKGRFVIEHLDLSKLVQEMAHLLGTVISKKATLRVDLSDSLPPVEADGTQLRQVVMNLITNASDALEDRSGTISLRTGLIYADQSYLATAFVNETLPEGPYVYLEVSDTGVGMDEKVRARIFDPFFTTKFTGRGLGLAAVMGIVRGHRGAIRLYSEVGRGTTFKILLPAVPGAVVIGRGPDAADDDWQGEGVVLVVDDEATVRAVGSRMLERMGLAVVTAVNGREGLAALERLEGRVSAVLLDMMMPELGGEDTFHEIRRRYPDLPVVLSSGYNEQDATSGFAGRGLAGFVQKPYQLEELRATFRRVLGEAPAGQA